MKTKLKIGARAAWSFLLATLVAFSVNAATETVGGYTWKYRIEGSDAIVTGPLSPLPVGSITIPNTLGGCLVKRIGVNVFSNCVDMTSIAIPDTTISIEHIDTSERCEFCGSSVYGYCSYSPVEKHRHGHGDGKCIWCGSKVTGECNYSPHGKHEM